MTEPVIEIERRFLTTSVAWKELADNSTKTFIKQAYPDSLQTAVKFGRVRSTYNPKTTNATYEEGQKGIQTGLATEEHEWEISQERFDALAMEAGPQSLMKWRWFILIDNVEFYVDQFTHIRHDRSSLVITEVEFTSEEQAKVFQPPSWVGQEITGNHRWSNFNLCTKGEPLVTA